MRRFLFAFAVSSCVAYALADNARPKLKMTAPMPTIVTATNFNQSEIERSNKTVISVLMQMNYFGAFVALGPVCTEAVRLALDTVANMVPNYEITIQPVDDQCTIPLAVSTFVRAMFLNNNITNRVPLSLMSLCSGTGAVGQFTRHFNMLGLAASTTTPAVTNNRRLYNSFYVLKPSPEDMYVALVKFAIEMGWRKMSILSETLSLWDPLEAILLREMQNQGVSLGALSKVQMVNGVQAGSPEIQAAIEELKAVDARVIVAHSLTGPKLACWMHRLGLFGPNVVVLFLLQSVFQANSQPRFNEWCSEKMVAEVLESVFYFGYSSDAEIYGTSVVASTGAKGSQLFDGLDVAVEDALRIPMVWSLNCYNNVLAAAYLLNETETSLRKSGDTLSNWFTNGENFLKNGPSILSTMNNSIYAMKYHDFMGDIDFDRATGTNSRGHVPIGFFQVQKLQPGDRLVPIPVAVFVKTQRPKQLTMGPRSFIWRTRDNLPPRDSLRVASRRVENVSFPVFVAILALAGFGFLANFGALMAEVASWAKRSSSLDFAHLLMFFGNMVLLAGPFSWPVNTSRHLHINCMSGYCLLVVGFSMILASMFVKLQLASMFIFKATWWHWRKGGSERKTVHLMRSRSKPHSMDFNLASTSENNSQHQFAQAVIGRTTAVLGFIALGWSLGLNAPLLAIGFGLDPLVTRVKNSTVLKFDARDSSLAYREFTFECVRSSVKDGWLALILCIALICCLNFVLLLINAFLAVSLRKTRSSHFPDTAQWSAAAYSTLILFLGASAIAAFVNGSSGYLFIVISAFSIVVTTVNFSTVLVSASFKRRPNGTPRSQFATGNNSGIELAINDHSLNGSINIALRLPRQNSRRNNRRS